MTRKALIFVALVAALALAAFVGTAHAGITCSTNAAAEIAGANVTGPRAGWDPPEWTFDMPDLNTSVDVGAYTRDDAAAKALTWLQGQVDAACAVAQPPPAPTTTPTPAPSPYPGAPDYTQQAIALLATATITYVGNSWGPIPIYRVELPTLNATIDVGANSADEARAAVVSVVVGMLAGQPAPVTSPSSPVTTTTPAPTSTSPTPTTTTTAPSAPSADQTAAAQALLAAATVTYVGNSWGQTPLYRVDLPSLNMSIDVGANSADEARAAVLSIVAARMPGAVPQPRAPAPTTAPTTTTTPTPTPDASPSLTPPTSGEIVAGTTGAQPSQALVELLATPLDPGIRAWVMSGAGG